MPIPVVCPQCQKRFTAPDHAAGKDTKCPNCQHPLTIPQPAANPLDFGGGGDEDLEQIFGLKSDVGGSGVGSAQPATPQTPKPLPVQPASGAINTSKPMPHAQPSGSGSQAIPRAQASGSAVGGPPSSAFSSASSMSMGPNVGPLDYDPLGGLPPVQSPPAKQQSSISWGIIGTIAGVGGGILLLLLIAMAVINRADDEPTVAVEENPQPPGQVEPQPAPALASPKPRRPRSRIIFPGQEPADSASTKQAESPRKVNSPASWYFAKMQGQCAPQWLVGSTKAFNCLTWPSKNLSSRSKPTCSPRSILWTSLLTKTPFQGPIA